MLYENQQLTTRNQSYKTPDSMKSSKFYNQDEYFCFGQNAYLKKEPDKSSSSLNLNQNKTQNRFQISKLTNYEAAKTADSQLPPIL